MIWLQQADLKFAIHENVQGFETLGIMGSGQHAVLAFISLVVGGNGVGFHYGNLKAAPE